MTAPALDPANDYDDAPIEDSAPHSLEAEQAVLGVLLHDNEAYHRIKSFIHPHQFYMALHGRIYGIIADLIQAGSLADAIQIKPRLVKDPDILNLGGAEYLANLVLSAPPPSTIGEYAKLVSDMALRRKGQAALKLVSDGLEDLNGPPAKAVLQGALETVRGLARQGVGQTNTIDPQAAMKAHLARKRVPSLSTGIPALDRICRLDRSALTILAGKTSMGKSALAVEMAQKAAERGEDVYFVSLEMDAAQIAARMVSNQMAQLTDPRQSSSTVGFPYVNIIRSYELNGDAIGMIQKEMTRLPKMRIDAEQSRLSTSDIIARASEGETPDLLIIDYLSKFDFDDCPDNLRHDQKIGLAVNRLRDFAKDTGCAVVLLTQLKRNGADQDTGVPSLDDLRDSGEIEQAADSVFFVHRAAYQYERKAHRLKANGESLSIEDAQILENCKRDFAVVVAKQRMGGIGTAHLRADVAHNYFYEAPKR